MHLFEYKAAAPLQMHRAVPNCGGAAHVCNSYFIVWSTTSRAVHNAPLTPHKHHPPPTTPDTDIETNTTTDDWTGGSTHKERGLSWTYFWSNLQNRAKDPDKGTKSVLNQSITQQKWDKTTRMRQKTRHPALAARVNILALSAIKFVHSEQWGAKQKQAVAFTSGCLAQRTMFAHIFKIFTHILFCTHLEQSSHRLHGV